MEKGPRFEIIGEVAEKDTEKFRNAQKKVFKDQNFSFASAEFREKVDKYEKPKSRREKDLINFAGEEVNKLMAEAGCEPFEIPEKNYHVIPREMISELGKPDESYSWSSGVNQGIIISDYWEQSPVHFGRVAFHETMHLKSYIAFHAKNKEKLSIVNYRNGIKARRSDRKDPGTNGRYIFEGLNEAVVAESERGFVEALLDSPDLKSEKEWYESPEIKKVRHEVALMKGIPEEEICWMTKHDSHWCLATYSYPEQRKVLSLIAQRIVEKFPDEYPDQEAVLKEFRKANFTGNLLTIGRLIEGALGKGSLAIIAEMGVDNESAVETLKKIQLLS